MYTLLRSKEDRSMILSYASLTNVSSQKIIEENRGKNYSLLGRIFGKGKKRERVTVCIVGCSSNRFTRSSYHTVRSLAVFRRRGCWGSQVRPLRPQPRGCRPIWRPPRIRRPRPRSRHRRRRFWNRPTCSNTGRRQKRRRIVNRSPLPTRGWEDPCRRRRNSVAVPPTSRAIPRGGRRRSSDTWVHNAHAHAYTLFSSSMYIYIYICKTWLSFRTARGPRFCFLSGQHRSSNHPFDPPVTRHLRIQGELSSLSRVKFVGEEFSPRGFFEIRTVLRIDFWILIWEKYLLNRSSSDS